MAGQPAINFPRINEQSAALGRNLEFVIVPAANHVISPALGNRPGYRVKMVDRKCLPSQLQFHVFPMKLEVGKFGRVHGHAPAVPVVIPKNYVHRPFEALPQFFGHKRRAKVPAANQRLGLLAPRQRGSKLNKIVMDIGKNGDFHRRFLTPRGQQGNLGTTFLLYIFTLSDKLSNMKKVTSRQFQKAFAKLNASLKPGEVVQITKHNKPIGQFSKTITERRRRLPNLLANLENLSYTPEEGAQMLQKVNDCLS